MEALSTIEEKYSAVCCRYTALKKNLDEDSRIEKLFLKRNEKEFIFLEGEEIIYQSCFANIILT